MVGIGNVEELNKQARIFSGKHEKRWVRSCMRLIYVEFHIKIYIIDWKKEIQEYKNIKSDRNIYVIYFKSS